MTDPAPRTDEDRAEIRRLPFVARLPNFYSGDVTCRGCGRTIHLYFNGGELDEKRCCGFIYRTEHVQVDLVIKREEDEFHGPYGRG